MKLRKIFITLISIALLIPINVSAKTLGDLKAEYNALEQDHKLLVDAIKRNWFTFFLQPKVDLNTNKVISAESLVRLIHPTYGLISPAKIIPILD